MFYIFRYLIILKIIYSWYVSQPPKIHRRQWRQKVTTLIWISERIKLFLFHDQTILSIATNIQTTNAFSPYMSLKLSFPPPPKSYFLQTWLIMSESNKLFTGIVCHSFVSPQKVDECAHHRSGTSQRETLEVRGWGSGSACDLTGPTCRRHVVT